MAHLKSKAWRIPSLFSIENELTAELIGEYLFTDSDFVNRLSAEKPTLFKKIFDEIKYLCKVATAGSKEARQLEKVKKTFEEAYRQKNNTATDEGVKYSFGITQTDIDNYVDAAYKKENVEDYKKYAEASPKLISDVADEIDISGYVHVLRDNDIRHIKNSHGEDTNEKYPITSEDIKQIPWVVENYDKVFVKTNSRGKPGIVYVKVTSDNAIYYVEAVTEEYHNEKLLVNKQMIKTGFDEIPNLHGLISAIDKKEGSSQYLADLEKIRKAYVQDVKGNYLNNIISNSAENVKKKQLEIINQYSHAPNTYNTWVRSVNDIKTFEEEYRQKNNTATDDGVKYSVANIEEILYNNDSPLSITDRASTKNNSSIKWVYDAQIFSVTENKKFHQKISEINQGSESFSKTVNGEYMIPIENKIVFTDGNYDSPYISEVVEVLTDSATEFEVIRERIFNVEKGKSSKQDAVRTIKQVYGDGNIVTYRSGNDGVYDWQNGKRKGKSRSTVIRNYLNKQYRRGNDNQSKEFEINNTNSIMKESSTDDSFFDASKKNAKMSLSNANDDIGPVRERNNIYGEDIKLQVDGPVREDAKSSVNTTKNKTPQNLGTTTENINKQKNIVTENAPIKDASSTHNDLVNQMSDIMDETTESDVKSNNVSQEFTEKNNKSFGIEKPNDYVHVQKQVFNTLKNEGFFTGEDNSRIDYNEDSGMVIETNRSVIKETFNFANYSTLGKTKKAIKLATIRKLPEIIKNGKLVDNDVNNYHSDNSSTKFAYIQSTIDVDGNDVSVQIDIKKSPQKNKFWVHRVYVLEKANELPAVASGAIKQAIDSSAYEDSVPNPTEDVKEDLPDYFVDSEDKQETKLTRKGLYEDIIAGIWLHK